MSEEQKQDQKQNNQDDVKKDDVKQDVKKTVVKPVDIDIDGDPMPLKDVVDIVKNAKRIASDYNKQGEEKNEALKQVTSLEDKVQRYEAALGIGKQETQKPDKFVVDEEGTKFLNPDYLESLEQTVVSLTEQVGQIQKGVQTIGGATGSMATERMIENFRIRNGDSFKDPRSGKVVRIPLPDEETNEIIQFGIDNNMLQKGALPQEGQLDLVMQAFITNQASDAYNKGDLAGAEKALLKRFPALAGKPNQHDLPPALREAGGEDRAGIEDKVNKWLAKQITYTDFTEEEVKNAVAMKLMPPSSLESYRKIAKKA